MENLLLPVCLDEYCNFFGVDFNTLHLPCIFCRHSLDTVELLSFKHKRLSLVWRKGKCYAACAVCVRQTAAIEKFRYSQCSVSGEFIEHVAQKRLQELIVRCLECMTLLSPAEKVDIIASGECFYLVRGHWKGICSACGSNARALSNYA